MIHRHSFTELPFELWSHIVSSCDPWTFSRARQTCRHVRDAGALQSRILAAAHAVFHNPLLYMHPCYADMRRFRIVTINALSVCPTLFFDTAFPVEWRHNEEMQKTAFVAARFLKNPDMCATLLQEEIRENGYSLHILSAELETYLSQLPGLWRDLPSNSELWKLHAYVLHSPYIYSHYEHVSQEIRSHFEISLANVQRFPHILQHLDRAFHDNDVLVTEAVSRVGSELEHASPRLQDTTKIVHKALKQYGGALAWASERHKRDYKTILIGFHDSQPFFMPSYVLSHMRLTAEETRNVFLMAIRQCGKNILQAPPHIQREKRIALIAVRQDADVLKDLPFFQDDDDVVMAAVEKCPCALEHASPRLKNTDKVVQTAVGKRGWGWVLRHASIAQRQNRITDLIAVRSSGHALEFVLPPWNDDEEIVGTALHNTKYAGIIRHASPRLQALPELFYHSSRTGCSIQ